MHPCVYTALVSVYNQQSSCPVLPTDLPPVPPALQLKRLFRYVIELPRSTVKLSHQGEVLEVTSFRGISRAASMFGVAMDAGGFSSKAWTELLGLMCDLTAPGGVACHYFAQRRHHELLRVGCTLLGDALFSVMLLSVFRLDEPPM